MTLSTADESKTFKQVNIHKAAGPDGFPGCVIQACADQLASVFTDIFNLSLTESVIPTMFQADHYSPCVQEQQGNLSKLLLTHSTHIYSHEVLERLVMAHISTIIPETLDPLQFAYCPNRSTDDAISNALYTALSQLKKETPI